MWKRESLADIKVGGRKRPSRKEINGQYISSPKKADAVKKKKKKEE